jgi:phosphoenolpyruvate synthase
VRTAWRDSISSVKDFVELYFKRNRGWPWPEENWGLTPMFGDDGWCHACGVPKREQAASLVLQRKGLSDPSGAWVPNWQFDVICMDDEVTELARHALVIEEHYGRPMDIEWGKDGLDGKLYILQARPETVQSRRTGALERFKIDPATTKGASVLVEGRAIGQKIGAGPVRVLTSLEDMHTFNPGEVLVADMTDPDWEPIMKRASAIVTNRGGRTCHAAIIARELGIPAVVGTGGATRDLADGTEVTVSCAEGDTGLVYDGVLDFSVERTELDSMPEVPVKIMMNVGTPEQAFAFSRLPHKGVGLARLEFIINRQIGVHPKALLDLERDPDGSKGWSPTCAPRSRRSSRRTTGRATSSSSAWPRAWPRSRRPSRPSR